MVAVGSSPPNPSVALIGGGRWGWNLARNLYEMDALGAVADRDPKIRRRVERELAGVVVLEDAKQAFDGQIRAVIIATPASTHVDLGLEALHAGKDVLVEKPFALNVEDAERMVAEADDAGRILMVGHLLLYQPAILWLKQYLDSGAIGQVATLYQDRLNLGTVRTVENALWSLGVHDVAALLYLVGKEPVQTATWGQAIIQPDVQDDMHLHMKFDGGVEAHIHNSWLWPERRRRLTVVGTEGMISYDELDQTVQLHRRSVKADLSVKDDGSEVLFHGDAEPLRYELEHFLECVRDRKQPRSNGASAIPVIRVLAEADRHMKELNDR